MLFRFFTLSLKRGSFLGKTLTCTYDEISQIDHINLRLKKVRKNALVTVNHDGFVILLYELN